MADDKDLYEIMSVIYETHRSELRVSPAWLATEAMNQIDPNRISPAPVFKAAHLQFRQIARGFCRKRFASDQGDQHQLFPDLQERYPTARSADDDEPEYVLLETLTNADVLYNVERLRAEGNAKLRHADALEAWARSQSAA